MSAAEEVPPTEIDAGVFAANDKVVSWRREEFLRMGLDTARAEIAACTRRPLDGGWQVDLHEFAGLRAAGASAVQAYRILA